MAVRLSSSSTRAPEPSVPYLLSAARAQPEIENTQELQLTFLLFIVPNQIMLPNEWQGALDLWYDAKGPFPSFFPFFSYFFLKFVVLGKLWAIYFTPPKGLTMSLVTIDISSGIV